MQAMEVPSRHKETLRFPRENVKLGQSRGKIEIKKPALLLEAGEVRELIQEVRSLPARGRTEGGAV